MGEIASSEASNGSGVNREELFKHIDLLQSCISRMSKDSFMVKGWAASFVIAVMVYLFQSDVPGWCILLLVLPVFFFWRIDAFFLLTERCYRLMYEYLVGIKTAPADWHRYDLNPNRYKKYLNRATKRGDFVRLSVWNVMWSSTLWPFYFMPILVILIIGGVQKKGLVTLYDSVKDLVKVECHCECHKSNN